jgi:hypothetical protein
MLKEAIVLHDQGFSVYPPLPHKSSSIVDGRD